MAHTFLLIVGAVAAWMALGGRLARSPVPAAGAAVRAGALRAHRLHAGGRHARPPGGPLARGLFHRVAAVCEWTLIVLSPVTRLALALGALLLKPFNIKPADTGDAVTEEDILQMVDIGEEKGAIEADEKEMIENIFEFNNMDAGDCMIHRKDITAIDIEATDEEILETIRESGLSRFPVYEDSIDNVLGILTTRDYLISQVEGRRAPLKELIRPAHFVPESVRTDVLFQEMQTRKQHMAIVVDEYGGTSGLITLEDLLEEIVGNIYDEFDPKEEPEITPLPDGPLARVRLGGAGDRGRGAGHRAAHRRGIRHPGRPDLQPPDRDPRRRPAPRGGVLRPAHQRGGDRRPPRGMGHRRKAGDRKRARKTRIKRQGIEPEPSDPAAHSYSQTLQQINERRDRPWNC